MPSLPQRIKHLTVKFKEEIAVYRLVLGHPGTPRLTKVFLGSAVAYALSPIDLIPDFIPVLGHLDDIVIIPLLVWIGLQFVPRHVLAECRAQVNPAPPSPQ